jgi:hypothetical protein
MQLIEDDTQIRAPLTEAQRRQALNLFSGLLGIPLVWFFASLCENVAGLVDRFM